MTIERLQTYLREMEQAAREIGEFLDGMTHETFLIDIVKQRAVGMNLLIIGEASMRLADEFPEFADDHPDIPWAKIRGMRNRIAHGYLSINLDTLWSTSRTAIPDLIASLDALRHWRAQGE
ncbi:MAG: DUF86 domain-containing protein [Neorhizobium sp.]|nr:DUF86 domain-containing protein [Neorhizobium sp.]